VYDAHPEVAAVVNAYPVNATAFSVTDAPLDTRTIPESYIFLRSVGRAPFGARFAAEPHVWTTPRNPAVILENDGVQVCGTSVLDAFDRLEVLESTCEAMINSRPLGPMIPMSDGAIAELERAFGLE
jgi:L-fuculose-phosphate aldolase